MSDSDFFILYHYSVRENIEHYVIMMVVTRRINMNMSKLGFAMLQN